MYLTVHCPIPLVFDVVLQVMVDRTGTETNTCKAKLVVAQIAVGPLEVLGVAPYRVFSLG